jgi:dihydrofolate reductase
MRKVTLYTATSLDGLIAGPNDELDWLDAAGEADDYGYLEFYESIDSTLMGHATYKVTTSFGEVPSQDKTNYVFTKGPLPSAEHVEFISGDIASFVRTLKEKSGKSIWLVGGGQINTVLLNASLIDEMILTVFPTVLGAGIPLFAPGAKRSGFKTQSCRSYPAGVIQWHMSR